jgi:hypothetical protein
MKNVHVSCKAFSIVILVLTFASLAHAQASRTWVSGTGTDAGTCTRLAPCLTFSFALTQTTAGGEIDALDPGDFVNATIPLVIDRAVTIDGTQGAGFASMTVPGSSHGITITTANTTDVVTIRNLTINGGFGGILITKAGTVHIENCVVARFNAYGIFDGRSGTLNNVFYLYVKDTISRNNGVLGGIGIFSNFPFAGQGVFLIASLTNVRSQDNNGPGVLIGPGTYASLDHCNVTGNRSEGIRTQGASGGIEGDSNFASVAVKNSVSSNNGTGIRADPNSIVRISGVQVFDNSLGLNPNGGIISSYGNNEIDGNTTDGAPSNTIPRK